MRGGLKNTENLRNIMRHMFRRVFLKDREDQKIPDKILAKFIMLFDGFCKTCLLYESKYFEKDKDRFVRDMKNFMSKESTQIERDEIFERNKSNLLYAFEEDFLKFLKEEYEETLSRDENGDVHYYVDELIDYGIKISQIKKTKISCFR